MPTKQELESEVAVLRNQLEQLKVGATPEAIASLDKAETDVADALTQSAAAQTELQNQLDSANAENTNLKNSLDDSVTQLATLRQSLSNRDSDILHLGEIKSELESQIKSLEEKVKELTVGLKKDCALIGGKVYEVVHHIKAFNFVHDLFFKSHVTHDQTILVLNKTGD